MTIALYGLTGADIGKIKKEQYVDKHTFDHLPEYCIKPDGSIDITKYWLQFIEEGDEMYYLFNILHIDNPLDHEIKEGGIDSLKLNFNFLKDFQLLRVEQLFYSMPKSTHIVVEVNYIGQGEDTESIINLMGYLDSSLELKSI